MSYDEFIDLVESMRKAQKDYFRTRLPSALENSKALEREVDRAVKAYEQAKVGNAEELEFSGDTVYRGQNIVQVVIDIFCENVFPGRLDARVKEAQSGRRKFFIYRHILS